MANSETRMDIVAEIVYVNAGVLTHIDDETRVMINLLKLDSIARHLYAPLDMNVICLS